LHQADERLSPEARRTAADAASSGSGLFQIALLVGVTLAVFSSTLSSGFVYDARLQILTDTFIHDSRNWLDVISGRVLGRDVLDFNRPVHLASLMLDAAIWGKEPFGYHLSSVLIHAGNVVLLWAVLRHLLRQPARNDAGGRQPEVTGPDAGHAASFAPGSAGSTSADEAQDAARYAWFVPLVAALAYAVHPLVTEAVCEPTFREDLLAAAATLGASLLAMGHAPSADRRLAWWRAAGCAVLCLLAVGSKESGVAAPLIVTTYWWLFRRGEPAGFWVAAIGGGAVLVTAFLAARFLLEPSPSVIFAAKPVYPGGSLGAALMILPRIHALYVQLVLLPVNQCADYGLYSVRHLPMPVAAAVLAVVGAALAWWSWRDRRVAFGTALVILPLVPVSNLVPIYRAAADRYLYLPLAGVAVLAACLLWSPWLREDPHRRRAALVTALVALVALGLACIARQRVWANPVALWEDTARRNPVAFTPLHGLAGALREVGRLADAERAAREAIRLDPSRGDAWMTLALVLDAIGRANEADAALERALELDPRLADPDARVAALALEHSEADALKRLLTRRPAP